MASALKSLLGMELPIIQAPMAGVQDSALSLAVSNVGGMGTLPCAMLDARQCEEQLKELSAGTDRPYGVNFFAHKASDPDSEQVRIWRDQFDAYYREFELEAPQLPVSASRKPFDAAMATLIEQFKPPVVSFHFGLPPVSLLDRVRKTGAKILSSATTLEEAIWLERQGVDGIIAQGYEAGGHRGMFLTDDLNTQIGTLALVSQIVKSVRVPVIAAGGIADAAGVRAVLALGAVAAQIGTTYLLCPESRASTVHRKALAEASERNTAITNVFTGRPARGLVNRIIREQGPMSMTAPSFPHATFASAGLRSRAESNGREDFSPLWSGQNATGCKEIAAADLTRELAGL